MARPDFVLADVDLSALNTLALPARAALFATIRSADQLEALVGGDDLRFVIGGGSNLVLMNDIDRLVLHMAIPGRALVGEDDTAWYVRANAGEPWHEFVQWTLAQGWPGLENLALIPGTAGAAPIQNIGAYGLEVGERIYRVSAIDMTTGTTHRFDQNGCRFGYRDSLFKQEGWHRDGRLIITDVTFRLPKKWQALAQYADIALELATRGVSNPTPLQIAEVVVSVRRRKLPDPTELANAGSFFQNPVVSAARAESLAAIYPTLPRYPQANGQVKLAAGWLIERVGWKGRALGPVCMYEEQALVLVNRGGATGADVLSLMLAVQDAVKKQFGIELHAEPVFL